MDHKAFYQNGPSTVLTIDSRFMTKIHLMSTRLVLICMFKNKTDHQISKLKHIIKMDRQAYY